jgi:MFS family permease
VLCLAGFVAQCLWSSNPFIDPALFRVRVFTGAVLVLAPFSAAFGAILLSIVLWDESVWGWSALKIGLAMAPGPLLVPIVSLGFSRQLIARFGVAPVISAGVLCFACGMVWWAVVPGIEPNFTLAVLGMVPTGIGVGLTMPTTMGASMASLPASSFATGSGAVNMIRQASMAIGVAVLVAVVGSPGSVVEHVAAFRRGWWLMAAITLVALVPALVLVRPRRVQALVMPLQGGAVDAAGG